ncbi:MAG: pyridoxamine 5'-phosphate oxidase family protein [Gammaproteobacteria bacterium]|nr:MAG: pyridoxamine 5'-phosphate oxidase family protein [Gammaproteobacteria bacterium]
MRITSESELRKLYSPAKGRAKLKQLNKLEKHSRNFINHSPFLVISTSSLKGNLDSSPRGGSSGFVEIINDKTIIIPDGKGNNRIDSLINITGNPNVGCLFFIPGVNETLRINGRAEVRTDPEYLELFANYTNTPKSVIKIDVEELFLHCAKALMRSKLWEEESKIVRSTFPAMGRMISDQVGDTSKVESQEAMVERYKRDL